MGLVRVGRHPMFVPVRVLRRCRARSTTVWLLPRVGAGRARLALMARASRIAAVTVVRIPMVRECKGVRCTVVTVRRLLGLALVGSGRVVIGAVRMAVLVSGVPGTGITATV